MVGLILDDDLDSYLFRARDPATSTGLAVYAHCKHLRGGGGAGICTEQVGRVLRTNIVGTGANQVEAMPYTTPEATAVAKSRASISKARVDHTFRTLVKEGNTCSACLKGLDPRDDRPRSVCPREGEPCSLSLWPRWCLPKG